MPAGSHFTQVTIPDRLPIQSVAMNTARSVVDKEMLPVCNRRGRRITMIAVMPLMGQLLSCCPAPDRLAVGSIQAEHIKAMNNSRLRVGDSWQRRRSFDFHPRLGYGFRGCLFVGRLCQKEEKFFIPNNGRGTAGAGQLHLPLNILGGTPLSGRLATGHGTIGIRSTPSRPQISTPQTWAKANETDDERYKYAHEHGESNLLDAGGQFFVRQYQSRRERSVFPAMEQNNINP